MARFNGSHGQRPTQWAHPEHSREHQAYPTHQGGDHAADPRFDMPVSGPVGAPPDGGHADGYVFPNGYGQPQPDPYQPRDDGYYADPHSQPRPQHPRPHPVHHPVDPFGRPMRGGHQGYDVDPPSTRHGGYEPAFGNQPPVDDLRGGHYDQFPRTAEPSWPTQPEPDHRSYDLGNYMPAGGQGDVYPRETVYGREAPTDWDRRYDAPPHSYGQDYAGDGALAERDGFTEDGEYEDDYEDEEYAEPRSYRRTLMVAVALIGAAAIGGGLAYGYKAFLAKPGGAVASAPVIKAGQSAKEKPADPGGRKFTGTESKLAGRVSGDSASDGRVRAVSTLVVGRDGSLSPPRAVEPVAGAQAAAPARPVAIPGLSIVGAPAPSAPAAAPPVAPPRTEPPMAVGAAVPPVRASQPASAPVIPQVVSRAEPTSSAPVASAPIASASSASPGIPLPPRKDPDLAAQAATAPARVASRTPEPRVQPTAPPVSAAPAAASAGGAAGYVAVLASQPSRMDALKTFADLQQRYTSVLQGKIPDVQAADLSSRGLGTMYRVVVGPPGSRDAASSVCTQLKSAGYSGCWVKAY